MLMVFIEAALELTTGTVFQQRSLTVSLGRLGGQLDNIIGCGCTDMCCAFW